MKALAILKQIKDLSGWIKCGAELPFDEEIEEAIRELEVHKNKSCENCSKSKKCQILHKFYLHRLKQESYAMHKNEFYCNQHDDIF